MTECKDKNFNTRSWSTSNCIYLITYCRCGLQYVGETVQSVRDRFSAHRTDMKNPFADNKFKILRKFNNKFKIINLKYLVFAEMQITYLTSLRNYLDLEEMTMVYVFLV